MDTTSFRIALTVAPPGAPPSAFVVYREPLAVTLPKAAELGYDGVELALLDRSQVDLPELRGLLASTGLSIPMVSTGQIFATGGCSFASSDPAVRRKAEDLFRGLIEVAAEFGAQVNIGRVRGAIAGNGTRTEVEARVADSLQRLSEVAAALGSVIALEPVNRYEIDFLNSCDEAVDFLDRFDLGKVKIMPDLFHMNIEDPSIEGALLRCAGRVSYVHLADSNRRSPGAGHLDFSRVVTTLRACGYRGWVGAEILPLPDPDSAAARAAEYLHRFI